MSLKGIDVSSWNGKPFNAKTEAAFKKSDFVIAKATQGTNYVNPACDYAVQRAIKAKKLYGVYHYAAGGNAKSEAAYFAKNVKGYLKHGIMCLDWESGSNPAFGNGSWVTTFVKEFYRRTKIYPVIYVQASAVNQIPAYVVKRCALWLAGYPENKDSWAVPKFNYSTGRWSACSIWQFSSGGGIDRNIAYMTASAWNKIAGKNSYKDSKENTVYTTPRKSDEQIADEVIAGAWGNGDDRRNRLSQAGYNPGAVQAVVNAKLQSSAPAKKTYIVRSGDTLSGIAYKYGTSWQRLADINGLSNPDVIYSGQVLTIG